MIFLILQCLLVVLCIDLYFIYCFDRGVFLSTTFYTDPLWYKMAGYNI